MNAADREPRTRVRSVGNGPVALREVDVGREVDPVPGRDGHVPVDRDAVAQRRDLVPVRLAVPRVGGDAVRAQLRLLDALGVVARQRVHEADVAGDREVGHLARAVVEQRLGRERRAGLEDDGDHHVRLGELRGDAVGRALEHRVVRVDRRLDLPGRDVLAAPPDAVLHPVDEGEVAALVEHARGRPCGTRGSATSRRCPRRAGSSR